MCNLWSDATWTLINRRRLYGNRPMGKKDAKEKKPRNSASRNSSSSRPGLERTRSVDQTESTAEGPDDDAASALSRSSSGGERARESTQVSKRHSHRTPGSKSPARRPTQRSTPARPLTRDLAGKYGDPSVSQIILKSGSNSADIQNPPTGDSSLGTLSQDRSPRSESICPVATLFLRHQS